MNGRNQESKHLGKVFAERLDPREQLSALLSIDKRHQAYPNLEHQIIQFERRIHGIDGRRFRRFFGGDLGCCCFGFDWLHLPGSKHGGAAENDEWDLGHSGN